MHTVVRPVERRDAEAVALLRAALWPDTTAEEHAREVADLLDGRQPYPFPLAILVAVDASGEVLGFAEVDLRSHADGCDARQPTGYLEGWYVRPEHRRRGVGRALVRAAEDWARSRGAREFASDTWATNEDSVRAHVALGFEVVDRVVNFRKVLTKPGDVDAQEIKSA
jgi:aminoglycoside 6'-N-acetyltransferase I